MSIEWTAALSDDEKIAKEIMYPKLPVGMGTKIIPFLSDEQRKYILKIIEKRMLELGL